jgi:hypothetical protein
MRLSLAAPEEKKFDMKYRAAGFTCRRRRKAR